MYPHPNMHQQQYPVEWQNYRFPPVQNNNEYYHDPYYATVYGTSSFHKHRKDKKKKRHSISQDQYEFYDRNRDYYNELKYLKKQLKQQQQQQDRPRSASGFRDTQNSIVLENGPLLMHPSSYVNYPMIMPDPMIDQSLGACTTDLMMPPPPSQPYYMQMPIPVFPPNLMMPSLFNNNNNVLPSTNQQQQPDTKTTTEPAAAAPVQQVEKTATTPAVETPQEKKEPVVLQPQPQPGSLQRRRSMMDSILSAFALPNTSDMPRPQSASNRQIPPSNSTMSPSSSSSSSKLEVHLSPGSDRSSMKLHQKIQALQTRDHLWCYKSPSNMWVAFDIKNQIQIDTHRHNKDDEVLVLTKQSHVPGPLYISLKANKAWYNAPDPIVFDVMCLPTEKSQFIVPPPEPNNIKRSKSLDMTNKLLNMVKMY